METAGRFAFFFGMVWWLAGCGGSPLERFKNEAFARAPYEMGCPRERLTVTALNGAAVEASPATSAQIGVAGCGKNAIYIHVRDVGWVLSRLWDEDPSTPVR